MNKVTFVLLALIATTLAIRINENTHKLSLNN